MAIDLNDPATVARLIAQERRQTGTGAWKLLPIMVLAAAYLTPLYYLMITIFKTDAEYAQGGVLDLPQSLAPFWGNVVTAWQAADLGRAAWNSLTYGVVAATAATGIAAAAAYGMTRLRLRGANAWFLLIFTGTLFPFQMYLVPLLFGYQRIGLANTWAGMALLYTAICIPFPLLVLRNSIGGIGREIDEAARIEGASEWRVFVSMILPNAKGPLIALFLIQFTFVWNDLLFSSILANGSDVRSVMVALQTLQGTYSDRGPNVVMTATLLSSLPTVILFLFLRRYFMAGLQLGTK